MKAKVERTSKFCPLLLRDQTIIFRCLNLQWYQAALSQGQPKLLHGVCTNL